MNADPLHGDTEIPICIIDSGYAKPHEDLQTKFVTASPDAGTGSPWTDDCGHGTHVAGTISAFDDPLGVTVRSTYLEGKGTEVELEDIDDAYHLEAAPFVGSAEGDVTAPLYRCSAVDGLGSPGDCGGAEGKVCLIQRGEISFALEAQGCQRKGGVVALISNSSDALFTGTLAGQGGTIEIPAVAVAGNRADYLEAGTGTDFRVRVLRNGNDEFLDGTSMATPHVSGVTAAVWSHDPRRKARDIRTLFDFTAQDIDAPGRATHTGHGLVDYPAAFEKPRAACTSMDERVLLGHPARARTESEPASEGGPRARLFTPRKRPLATGGRSPVASVAWPAPVSGAR